MNESEMTPTDRGVSNISSSDSQKRRSILQASVVVVGAGLLAGCVSNPSTDDELASKMRDPLPGLITADNRSAYAEQNNLTVEDGSVEVVVVVNTSTGSTDALSQYFTTIQTTQDEQVIGFVPFDSLSDLATEEQVVIIRPPAEAEPATEVSP